MKNFKVSDEKENRKSRCDRETRPYDHTEEFMKRSKSFRAFSLKRSSAVLSMCILIFLPDMALRLTLSPPDDEESELVE